VTHGQCDAKPTVTFHKAVAEHSYPFGRHQVTLFGDRGRLGRLALAKWAGWSAGQVGRHVVFEGGSRTEEAHGLLPREGEVYSDKLFAGVPEFLCTPRLIGPVGLISQGQLKEPVCPCIVSSAEGEISRSRVQ